MILKALAILVVVALILLVIAATRPNTVQVQRSVLIGAPPEKVFPLINDFHEWRRWAPQDREDPSMQRTYSGAVRGVGAVSYWHGKGSTGRGQMTITDSIPLKEVIVTTDFIKPFEAHNVNDFLLERSGASTKVTWTMRGTNLYPMKLMGLFVNMDRLMGKHFESGLENLKEAAEH
jgi:uncharacterized protein YndB with AHSA1/START domain